MFYPQKHRSGLGTAMVRNSGVSSTREDGPGSSSVRQGLTFSEGDATCSEHSVPGVPWRLTAVQPEPHREAFTIPIVQKRKMKLRGVGGGRGRGWLLFLVWNPVLFQ